jgi:hypothetical protein
MLRADDDACIGLLKKGMLRNPDAWELPYEIAMTYLLNRPDDPQSPIQAAKYLTMAIKTGKAPQHVLALAESLQRGHNQIDVERDMWEAMLKSDDALLRDLAERKLVLVELRVACANLNEAAARYAADHGAPPKSTKDLVAAGLLATEPPDPMGGRFFIDAEGKVLNTSVLDEQVERERANLRGAIGAYQKKNGRFPSTLEDLATSRAINALPPHPYPGCTWRYDPEKGIVD